ncbi:winged helix-turn-helix domain-containing protein [Alkalihalobacillus sp. MEB130]|uniref:winged helix-turn-helix domain-containing protein n=1 Tax=Alkalihalobacillus sp. MEB130 TaxID=2976704 RepID=UPI0028DED604|nr:winged helix-turn-helix domain-containing protein [Alkalihalobacillus sp. MEB130]MDT8860636.1 winged helix-turn-helix domain-containing protein [Alkalihalobacillus sp. MEB130]
MYNLESLRVMKFLKNLNEVGLTIPEIKQILSNEGLPKDEIEEKKIIEKYKAARKIKSYNEEIKDTIPSTGEMMIPYLELIKDGKAYTASEITEKLVSYFKLSEEQRLMKYDENKSDIIFLSKVRSVRYSLKKENYIDEVNKLTYQITNEGLELLKESKGEIKEEIEELEKVIDPLTIVNEKLDELKNELADNLLKQLQSITG